MALQAQYNKPTYKNWLRACLGLNYLKKGLQDFVDAEVKQFHVSIITKACGSGTCNRCTTDSVTKKHRCPNNVCDLIRREIEQGHRFSRPCWQNTDATRWCTDHWEIGKCFMSPGYATKSTAAETDCTGLLGVCINGTFLPPSLTGQIIKPTGQPGTPTDIFHENRDARNALLHSASMSISDAERQDYINNMTKLLTNYKTPVDHVTQAAIDRLIEVNTVDIDIYPALELALLQTKLEAMTLRQTELEGNIQDQSKTSGEHRRQIDTNTAAVAELSQKLEVLEKLHTDFVKDISAMQKTCKSLQDRNEGLNKRIHEIEKQLGEMVITVKDHTDKLDTIRKEVDLNTAARQHEPSLKDVQDFLMAKYKHDSLTVPLSPILRTHGVDVDEIYTELIIRDDLVHKPKRKTESESHTSRERAWFTSKTYKEVLYDNQMSCKNIYVVGDAGMGKTTWCRMFVATWLKALKNRGKQWEPSENESILREYDLVFFVTLRHATSDHHIMQMIKHQLFPDRADLMRAAETLLNNSDASSRCIIILDGLDEWFTPVDDTASDGIPVRDPTWQCPTITTTRAWKLEALQLEKNRIDRAVEIQGLEEDGSDKLIGHVISGLNNNTGQNKMVSDFKSQICKSVVKHCMQIPLLLTIFVCLWYDGVQINEHLAGTYTELIEMLLRCVEGDKKKKQYQKISPEKLAEMKKEWETEKDPHPKCLSAKQLIVTYWPFLLRLGKLAFNRLFSKGIGSTLVFDYQTITKILTDDELELSVKIGILSQTTHPGSALKQEFQLSFLHTTVQEYLAALYMVSGDSKTECLNAFRNICNDTYDTFAVLEMENVLLFISGLCPETAGEISWYISDMEENEHLHELLLSCWKESRAVSDTNSPIYIRHHFLEKVYDFGDEYSEYKEYTDDTLRYLREETDKTCILYINRNGEDMFCLLDFELLDLTRCLALRTLHYRDLDLQLLVPNSLEELYVDEYGGSTEKVLDLSGCQSLKKLRYTHSDVRILVPNSLEDVEIQDSYFESEESVLDLSGCQSLRNLIYKYACDRLILPNSLETLTLNLDLYTGSEEWVLDLSGCQSLRILQYQNSKFRLMVPNSLQVMDVKYYTGSVEWVLDLSGCQSLTNLQYRDSTVRLLVPNSLETLNIYRYTGSVEWVLDLSGCQSLTNFQYRDSNVRLLVPNSLETLNIDNYNDSEEWVLDLSGCQSLRQFDYLNSSVRIQVPNNVENIDISGYTCPVEWVLDLSGCKSMKRLHLKSSPVRILAPISVEEVYIDSYTGSDECVLDLSGCQSLRNLQYDNSNVRLLVPNSLATLNIAYYTGSEGWVLDLSGCQSLTKLQYAHSNVRLLAPNSLETLNIGGYTGSEEWVLDLSGCQSLRNLQYLNSNIRLLVPNNLEKLNIENYTGSVEWVLDLSGCQSLRQLYYSDSSVRIQVPNNVENMDISRYTCPVEWVLDLSGCQSMKTLSLHFKSSPVRILAPISVEEVYIHSYRLKGSDERVLDLSGCQSLRTLTYCNSDARIVVPKIVEEVDICGYEGSREWVLDLSGCQSLRKLTYRHSDVRILFVPKSVEGVDILFYKGSTEWVLDMSGCKSLRKLQYHDSDVRLLVPKSLEEVSIFNYTGSTEWVMDLSGCQSLRHIYCDSSLRILVPDGVKKKNRYEFMMNSLDLF